MSRLIEIEGRHFKECGVIILPTKDKTALFKQDGVLRYTGINLTRGFDEKGYHLYITSDDEIKVGDWITDNYRVWKWNDDSSLLGRKKIITTTDKSLITKKTVIGKDETGNLYNPINLPQPSQSFIEKYCELGGIEKVLVEYNEVDSCTGTCITCTNDCISYILKTDSHNTITIKEVKEKMYSETELISFIENYCKNAYNKTGYRVDYDWIKKNL